MIFNVDLVSFCKFWRIFWKFQQHLQDLATLSTDQTDLNTTQTRNRLYRLTSRVGFESLRLPPNAGESSLSWVQNRASLTYGQPYIYIPSCICFVFFSVVSLVLSHIKSWSSTMITHSLVSIGKMKQQWKLESSRISLSQLSSSSSRSKLRLHITSPFGSAILGKKSQYRFQTGVLARASSASISQSHNTSYPIIRF